MVGWRDEWLIRNFIKTRFIKNVHLILLVRCQVFSATVEFSSCSTGVQVPLYPAEYGSIGHPESNTNFSGTALSVRTVFSKSSIPKSSLD